MEQAKRRNPVKNDTNTSVNPDEYNDAPMDLFGETFAEPKPELEPESEPESDSSPAPAPEAQSEPEEAPALPKPEGRSPEGSAARSQNIVYLLSRTRDALERALRPALERLGSDVSGVQVVIVTPDRDTALMVSDVARARFGTTSSSFVPVTAANRAARLIEGKPIQVVAGPAVELQTLVQRSTLKLDSVSAVILAWADEIASAGTDALAALEALFADLPKSASRVLLAHRETTEVRSLIERYALRARRMDETTKPEDIGQAASLLRTITVSPTTRPGILQRLLDELDPPSAAIVVTNASSRAAVEDAIQQLGYSPDNDIVRITEGDVEPGTHTIVFYDAPVESAPITAVAEGGAVQIITMGTVRELDVLKNLAGPVLPLTLQGPGLTARKHDRVLREELGEILMQGVATRELLALEPLLDQYDGTEIAAAAVRLLEQERNARKASAPPPRTTSPSAPTGDGFGRPRREFRDRPFDRGDRDADKRPRRDFNEGPRKEARGDRPFGGRPFGGKPFADRDRDRGRDRPGGFRDRKSGGGSKGGGFSKGGPSKGGFKDRRPPKRHD